MRNIAYKYRLEPDAGQRELIDRTFGCCRKVWNLMLADALASQRSGGGVRFPGPAAYKKSFPYLREVDSLALAFEWRNLGQAFARHGDARGVGAPRFKSRKRDRRSYATTRIGNNLRLEGSFLRLPKAGLVRVLFHRGPPGEGYDLKSATVSREPDGSYYVSLLYSYESDVEPVKSISSHVGLDYASDGLYVSSEGERAGMPKYYKKAQRRLARLQRRVSRKRKGSRNREKARRKLARLAGHVANQRKDLLHKKSRALCDKYDLISVEDLNVKAMSRGLRGQGKAVHDNGWAMFTAFLAYKQARMSHYLIKIDRWFPSSQLCHQCGFRNPITKDLGVRHIDCPVCGAFYDRDINAAMNIDREGLRVWGETKAA